MYKMDRIKNDEVLQRAKEERLLLNTLRNKRHSWIGHKIGHNEFYIHGSVHRESNLNVQQDATYSVYYISVGSSTCFGC